MSDHGHFSSYEGHKERQTGNTRGAFSRMHRALDGWMLARAPASPAQGTRNISCACEQQQGTFPSTFAVCNVDYIVDLSSSDGIAREHFRFLEHRF